MRSKDDHWIRQWDSHRGLDKDQRRQRLHIVCRHSGDVGYTGEKRLAAVAGCSGKGMFFCFPVPGMEQYTQ